VRNPYTAVHSLITTSRRAIATMVDEGRLP
jgi:hypothetical protein